MANVINKTTLQLLYSVNTPDYPTTEWIINPVLPACEAIYWKIVGDTVQEMTQPEKDAVDAAIAAAAAQAEADAKDITISFEKLLKAFALTVLDEINILRDEHGLAARTVSQLKNAVSNKYDTL
jgi:hypothetical protein